MSAQLRTETRASHELEKSVQDDDSHTQDTKFTSIPEIGGVKWLGICAGLYLSAMLYGMDTTIAADMQGPILDSLGDITLLPWVGIGFPLGSVAVILPVCLMFGMVEIKWLYIGSLILFEIGSAVCGAAQNMQAMTVGRVLAGVGGAGVYLGCLNYVSALTPLSTRGAYTGLIAVFWGLGAILGPLIGGAFATSSATWRWSFYINLVVAAVTAPIYLFWLPKHDQGAGTPVRARLAQIDWAGATLNAAMYVLFLIACTFSGTTYAWSSGTSIALWVLTGASTIGFVLQQWFAVLTTRENRIFPVQLLKSRSQILQFIASAAVSSSVYVPVYYVPLFFQFTRNDSAIRAAVRLLPYICVFVVCTIISGWLLPKIGFYAPWYLLSGILCVAGGALMYTVESGTSTSAIYGFEVLVAAGAGFTMQMGYTISASKVKPAQAAEAIGFINVAQIGSAAVTLAISGAIFQNVGLSKLKHALAAYDFSDEDLRGALSGGQSQFLADSSTEVRALAVNAIAETISSGYALIIATSALLVVSSVLMRWERLQLST